MLRPVTRALIEGQHRHSGIYRDYLANHLPMGLVALDAMGASDEQLVLFARANEAKLEPMDAPEHPYTKELMAAAFDAAAAPA